MILKTRLKDFFKREDIIERKDGTKILYNNEHGKIVVHNGNFMNFEMNKKIDEFFEYFSNFFN